MAALHPGLDLLGVTTVWGNVAVEHATDNTLRVLDHVGRTDAVDTAAGPAYGRTRLDLDGSTGRPPDAHVALQADRDRFVGLLETTLG